LIKINSGKYNKKKEAEAQRGQRRGGGSLVAFIILHIIRMI
jgi:hypothetical protein